VPVQAFAPSTYPLSLFIFLVVLLAPLLLFLKNFVQILLDEYKGIAAGGAFLPFSPSGLAVFCSFTFFSTCLPFIRFEFSCVREGTQRLVLPSLIFFSTTVPSQSFLPPARFALLFMSVCPPPPNVVSKFFEHRGARNG